MNPVELAWGRARAEARHKHATEAAEAFVVVLEQLDHVMTEAIEADAPASLLRNLRRLESLAAAVAPGVAGLPAFIATHAEGVEA